MTNTPHRQHHTMTVHRSSEPLLSRHATLSCCDGADTHLTLVWRNAPSAYLPPESPGALERVLAHVTLGHSDAHTAHVAETARALVGLNGDALDCLNILNEQLDYLTVEYRDF
ncbi:hypothetical protein ACFP3Q_06315 [Nocardioides sp. GCM10027113]|uniref:hypothetical protein n=1 Tax=unclassified Nocardioides TaxID=2615069 RepID=UPI0036101476